MLVAVAAQDACALRPMAASAGSGILGHAMGENAELLRTGYEAWNRDDCDAWLELLDPEIEIRTSGVFPDLSSVYQGRAGALRFWQRFREAWSVFRIEVEEMEERGDTVAAAIRFRATGIDSGVEVDMRFGHAIRVRDGLAIEFVTRRAFEEAREALPPEQPSPPTRTDAPVDAATRQT
jgi:ketosteroid isomerase-like protein